MITDIRYTKVPTHAFAEVVIHVCKILKSRGQEVKELFGDLVNSFDLRAKMHLTSELLMKYCLQTAANFFDMLFTFRNRSMSH